jgi:alpha/beta hydrolase fold
MERLMPKCDDLGRSLIALDQDSMLIAVVELSHASWLVGGLVPGLAREPLKKLAADPDALLRLLHRWRDEATAAGRPIGRICVAYEAGRDRHSPEHKFPAQIHDMERAYRWLLAHGIRPENIASIGHSVGGNFAVSLAVTLREKGVPLPAAILSVSPGTMWRRRTRRWTATPRPMRLLREQRWKRFERRGLAARASPGMSEGGVLVSYGGMSRRPMVVQPGSLIFKKQTVRGFWLLYWYQSAKPDETTAMFDHLAPLVAAGTISTPVVATYRFDQVKEAVTRAAQSGGKVLFTPQQ